MEIKHNRPAWVLNFKKPIGTEIKYINGHWYLYERSSIWDSEKGKAKKKSGKLIGTITENGLILKKEKQNVEAISCFEFGASTFLFDHSSDLRERLETYYSDFWKPIYALVLMKVKENCCLSEFRILYEVSFLKFKIGKLTNQKIDIKKAIIYLAEQIEILENFFNIEECNQLLSYYENLTKKEFTVGSYFLDNLSYKNLQEDILLLKRETSSKTREETLSYGLAIINYMAIHVINSINTLIAEKGYYNTYRVESVIQSLKTVYALKNNRNFNITKLFKEVEKLCLDLDIKIAIKN
ncbi:MAG: hypothetical protein PQJ49_05435 [Sphaerochaetaceae bacterium]|nr:hypothetical protein [Sphaerochaetaceae bacterium]MDC7236305.1 hypothetical protein [Sphaerochaetaceae bacterium]MDC7249345.1 hypothetical protein [Sphaerochaetaceae bacterium]